MMDGVTGAGPAFRPELLAPAGDWQAMRAAVANGADAVYFGLSNYNARHRATNFSLEELPTVMAFLHDHNVRGYVTFNTLIFSDELADAVRFIEACARAGADALIVQDLGVARLIRAVAPALPVHGSTQMTLTDGRGIEFVRRLGVQRVILARELSVDDVQRIRAATDVPVEVFVHGALCVAYSGQCLTSEALGGRSANRGQCAQACRLPYDLIVDGLPKDLGDKAYLLSPQDLAAYDLVADLVQLGVCSLKIEGRLKSAHYVAATTQTYRSAVDAAISNLSFEISKQQYQNLAQSFSRGFTHGFLEGVNHQELVHARFPKSRGIRIGIVRRKSGRGVMIELDRGRRPEDVKAGDGIVFDEGHPEQDEQGGRIAGVTRAGHTGVELSFQSGDVNLAAVEVGSIVWKTDDPAVRKRLEQSYAREGVARRVRLDLAVTASAGGPLRVEATDEEGLSATVQSDEPMQRAEKHPLTLETAREQLGRLGQTPYELGALRLDAEGVMAPKSVLNELRRRAVDALMALRAERTSRRVINTQALEGLRHNARRHGFGEEAGPRLSVLARTMDQLRAIADWSPADGQRPEIVYCDFEDVRRYKDAASVARAAGLAIALATLRVVKPHEHGLLRQIADCKPDGVLVRNLAAVSFYREHAPELAMYGDYSLNIANELTAAVFAEAGLRRMVPSYDLSWRQMAALFRRFDPGAFEAVVHQHMPMFHMEHCVFAHTLSSGKDFRDCGRPCERHAVDLRDRVGEAHPLIPDVGCRNTVYNATAQSAAEYVPRMKEMGVRHFRVELLRQTADEVAALLDRYAQVLAGDVEPRAAVRSLRVLGRLGVTAGTLERE
jgi:putative protease